jgi:SAM-dependent methyltransferase
MQPTVDELLTHAFKRRACLLFVISQRRRNTTDEFTKVSVRPVTIRDRPLWQFTYQFPRKVAHENYDASNAIQRIGQLLADTFEQGALSTPEADWAIRARPDGTFRVTSSPPTRAAAATTHDRTKEYIIPDGVPCPFLIEAGVMTPAGQVRRSMYHKFRQINRFLELVNDVIPALPGDRTLQIVDFGCGKSYLTFALHHLLTVVHKRSVHIVGLDRLPDVIRTCSDLAQRLDCAGLEFQVGDIAGYTPPNAVDLAVSLHACDTATDAALAQAVRWKCAVVLAVPCCQKELAPLIHNVDFAPLTRHGILHERFAAQATDALRAALLESRGYATQVVEFIDMEHTPKNVLIRAVRRPQSDEAQAANRFTEYRRLLAALGLESCAFERELARR